MRSQVAPADLQELWALRPGVYRVRDGSGRHHLVAGRATEPLGDLDPAVDGALRRLAGPATSVDAIGRSLPAGGRPTDRALDVQSLLTRLRSRGWLSITVARAGRPLYTLVPDRAPPGHPGAAPADDLVLSRFALLRRAGDRLVLESPRSWCTIQIHDPGVLAAVGAGYAGGDGAAGPVEPPDLAARLRRDLWWAGVLAARSGSEDSELRLRQWSPHELWFHARARVERPDLDGGFGGTWWARGRFPALPAAHDPFDGPVTRLGRPDLTALRTADPSLTEVLESRRTVREQDDGSPLTVEQLGELLYRCCRNRRRWVDDDVEYLSRPYPAGGSFHELELYPVVRQVTGLAAGLYHYDPQHHHLTLVRGPGRVVDRLLRDAVRSAGLPGPPQVLLVIAARFGRVMWKYEAMAYALILKHVGVLYQVMYTVATAMGLAPCGLGGGDPDAFQAATGLDPLVEGSVGEFLLGSRPTTP